MEELEPGAQPAVQCLNSPYNNNNIGESSLPTTVPSVFGMTWLCRQSLIIVQLENSLKLEINGEYELERLSADCIVIPLNLLENLKLIV